MYKKWLAAFLVLSLLLCTTACGMLKERASRGAGAAKIPETTEAPAPTVPETTEATIPEETEPSTRVDLEKLKQIEDADDFGVTLDSVRMVENGFHDGTFTLEGYDAIVLNTKNNTDKTISQITILALATDEYAQGTTLAERFAPISVVGEMKTYSKFVESFYLEVEMAPGKTESGGIRCNFDKFENVNLMIYSYTDADGNEVINENCEEWLLNTVEVEMN